jgi:Flp pilus assembly pilin Flp
MNRGKAQSFIEYALLIALVAASLIAMWGYVMGSVDARVSHVWADLYDPQTGVR